MLSTLAHQSLSKQLQACIRKNQTFQMVSSLTTPPSNKKEERRQIHSTVTKNADVPVEKGTLAEETIVVDSKKTSGIVNRFVITAEVTVSKIFPAGFGWQTSSIIAANHLGYASDTMAFAVTTGLGDAIGVVAGHCAYYSAKKALVDKSINLEQELQTGVLLGSGAFCSGTAWQPIVNALQGANLSFMEVFTGTWIGCGLAFYGGLRVGRTILSGYLDHIAEPTYENSKTDVSLSVAIGGATGFFCRYRCCLPTRSKLFDQPCRYPEWHA